MTIQHYRDLEIWKLGMDLAEACYRATQSYPKGELFGLTSQIRRAAASIPANIAEGHGRQSTRDYLRFLSIARGSLMELETHLLLSQRVGLLSPDATEPLLKITERIGQMMTKLRQALMNRL
jgi:four helix bundle protein